MITKKKLLKSIKDLPESFSLDELLDRMIFLQKVEMGLEQSAKNQSVSSATAKTKLKKWLK